MSIVWVALINFAYIEDRHQVGAAQKAFAGDCAVGFPCLADRRHQKKSCFPTQIVRLFEL